MFSLHDAGENRPAMRRNDAGLAKRFASSACAALLSLGLMSNAAQANSSCGLLAGAYLLTVTDGSGNFASRQVLTLTADGNAFVIDSNQGGVTGVFNPFTSEQGSWDCQSGSPALAHATLLDFSLPGSVAGGQSIARADYQITFGPGMRTISGKIELRFFPLTGNPFVSPLPPPAASDTFTGVVIK